MIRFGIWYGGANYSHGEFETSMEMFEDLKIAKLALQRRAELRRDHFTYMNSVDRGSLFEVRSTQWFDLLVSNPQETFIDLYECYNMAKWNGGDTIYTRLYLLNAEPYARLSLGPRGGVIRESF